jgi:hypothetical protein
LKNPEHVELCGQQKMSENVVVIDDALGWVYRIFGVCAVYKQQVGYFESRVKVIYLYDENSIATNFIMRRQTVNWVPALISLIVSVGFKCTYSLANWTDYSELSIYQDMRRRRKSLHQYSELVYIQWEVEEEWARISSKGK